jgi:hypothetical protein
VGHLLNSSSHEFFRTVPIPKESDEVFEVWKAEKRTHIYAPEPWSMVSYYVYSTAALCQYIIY